MFCQSCRVRRFNEEKLMKIRGGVLIWFPFESNSSTWNFGPKIVQNKFERFKQLKASFGRCTATVPGNKVACYYNVLPVSNI